LELLMAGYWGGEVAVSVRCGDPATHQEITAGNKHALRPHQQHADRTDLIRHTTASGGAQVDPARIAGATPPADGQGSRVSFINLAD
jgi:hypothetical protein